MIAARRAASPPASQAAIDRPRRRRGTIAQLGCPRRVPLLARAAAQRRARPRRPATPSSSATCTSTRSTAASCITPFHNMALMCPATTRGRRRPPHRGVRGGTRRSRKLTSPSSARRRRPAPARREATPRTARSGRRAGRRPGRRVEHAPAAVGAHPPQRAPLVGVVVDEQRDQWVLSHVGEPAQAARDLRLDVVDGAVDRVAVHREADRDEVRAPTRIRGRQPRHSRGRKAPPRLRRVHHISAAASSSARSTSSRPLLGNPKKTRYTPASSSAPTASGVGSAPK